MTKPDAVREALAELVAVDAVRRDMRSDLTEESYRAVLSRSAAAWKAALAALSEQPAPTQPVSPNNEQVICPSCCHQFRAIPVQVQQLLSDSGHEPPFTAPPASAQPARVAMSDEQIKAAERASVIEVPCDNSPYGTIFKVDLTLFARAVIAEYERLNGITRAAQGGAS